MQEKTEDVPWNYFYVSGCFLETVSENDQLSLKMLMQELSSHQLNPFI